MYKDPTEWRDGFRYWQETGELPWSAGKRLPRFAKGKETKSLFLKVNNYISDTLEPYKIPESKRARAMYNEIDPRQDAPSSYIEAANREYRVRRKMYGDNLDVREYELEPNLADSVSDAAWRKRLGYGYDKKFLIPNEDGSVRLPLQIELEIPVDTTMLKERIANTDRLMNYSNKYKYNKFIQVARDVDQLALDALRKTYKTGKPVVVNEHAFNSRHWVNDGNVDPTMSPLNVLGNFTLLYDKENNVMNYKDMYDFNQFDWGVPGKKFPIAGSIKLKNPPTLTIKMPISKRKNFYDIGY